MCRCSFAKAAAAAAIARAEAAATASEGGYAANEGRKLMQFHLTPGLLSPLLRWTGEQVRARVLVRVRFRVWG